MKRHWKTLKLIDVLTNYWYVGDTARFSADHKANDKMGEVFTIKGVMPRSKVRSRKKWKI